ncbi:MULTISPECIES: hypothetical protein [Pseudomonadota]|uniref:hypothetical protein n=1 Tax=Pseudomonadota TaxID=1224 RepID=UPI00261F4451|nr:MULTISPECIES: hypothetical protein [Pseudomonadota]
MRAKALDICPCCGQTVAKNPAQRKQKHIDAIEQLYDVTFEEMSSRTKIHRISLARNHYWFLLVVEERWSLTRAGASTGHGAQPALQGTRRIANQLLGTHMKMSLDDIRIAYWKNLGFSDEQIEEKVYG